MGQDLHSQAGERSSPQPRARRQPGYISAALLGLLTTIPLTVIAFIGNQLAGLPFMPFSLFDWLARVLPGPLVTFGIDSIVAVIMALHLGTLSQTAKLAEQLLAVGLFLVIGVLFGVVLAAIGRRRGAVSLTRYGLAGGLVLALALSAVVALVRFPSAGPVASIVWLLVLMGGWGGILGWLLQRMVVTATAAPAEEIGRRQAVLVLITGAAALVVGAVGLGYLLQSGNRSQQTAAQPTPRPGNTPAPGTATPPPTEAPAQETEVARIEPAPGTRTEVTPNPDFYRIDINTQPPEIDGQSWRLELTGLVDNPMTLSIDDIRARPAQSQDITLSCISNPIGGSLISTALWTGTRLKDLLQEAGMQDNAQVLQIESVDGFHETVVMDDMMDDRTLLVYEMNGEPLPVAHGYPLRIYIPNRYGMKQPKWITRMEVAAQEKTGYWVQRGWSHDAIPRTTSVIDNVDVGQVNASTKAVPIGGIAYAGARGISKVEVQIDDGPWTEAELRVPPLSQLTWVQWRYDWPVATGRHTARVRAYDGTGTLQVVEEHGTRPDGATGIDSYDFSVEQAA